MTEAEARARICGVISGWVGGKRGGREHIEILNAYNAHKPLPRGYAVKPTDAYCATTVSAAAILAGYDKYIPIECSCNEMIAIAQRMGIWVEDDAYIPKPGDILLYDWQDSGSGDNRGSADHIGIVTDVRGDRFTVTEGNIGGNIDTREWYVNRPQTRGYIAPDYAAIAREAADPEEATDADRRYDYIEDMPDYYREEAMRLVERGALRGKDGGRLDLSEDMLRTLIICQRMVDETL